LKTPTAILEKFEQAAVNLDYGSVSLTVHMKGGAARFVIQKEESFIPTDVESASTVSCIKEDTGKLRQEEIGVGKNG